MGRLGPNNYEAFGKLQRASKSSNNEGWLPLTDHMADVARCFERLCQCHSLRRALTEAAARELDGADIARLSALVFLHDIGKACSGFQAKRWPTGKRPSPDFWPPATGHGREALALFTSEHQALALALPLDAMESWGEAVWPLLLASISHHGRPIVEDASSVSTTVWSPVRDADGASIYDPLQIIEGVSDRVRELFPDAFNSPVERPLPENPAFGHLFAGMVQFADWLGSDTRHFPVHIEENRGESARDYAEKAVTALGMDVAPWRDWLERAKPSFQQTFALPAPHPIQAKMADDDLGPLVILESETGSGKTEAALWRFVHLFRAGKVDSLYFALPTRVSAKQVYDRVRTAISRLWPDDPPLTVRALPGYAAADGEEPKMLPEFKVQWNDNPNDDEALRRWAAEAPKRFLAAPIAVGTIDQALFGILKVKHAHMRYALLSRCLLVVDEVHASDAYMTVLLEKLLKAHLGNGGHALLLSATLGSSARSRYQGLESGNVVPLPFEQAVTATYPALTERGGLRPIGATGRKKPVRWSLHDCMDDPERIVQLAIEAARAGAKVLIVRNTVPAATEIFSLLEKHPEAGKWLFQVNGVATLHHSRFSRQDRPLLDAAIETELGKERPLGQRIVIGTQTLEQSLDIDADLLITDICPMDVLLQRIGRLHRHKRDASERPADYASAQALILTPANGDFSPMLERPQHGLGRFSEGGGVYPDLRIIAATHRLVQNHPQIEIPTGNRMLVESATHPDRLAEIEQSMGVEWLQHGQKLTGDIGANRTVAHLHVLETDKAFASEPNMAFPTDHKIASRLGAEDRLVEFEPPLSGPFGIPIRALPIRSHLLPNGLGVEAQPEGIVAQDGVIEFMLGGRQYRYSRLGLEYMKDG